MTAQSLSPWQQKAQELLRAWGLIRFPESNQFLVNKLAEALEEVAESHYQYWQLREDEGGQYIINVNYQGGEVDKDEMFPVYLSEKPELRDKEIQLILSALNIPEFTSTEACETGRKLEREAQAVRLNEGRRRGEL